MVRAGASAEPGSSVDQSKTEGKPRTGFIGLEKHAYVEYLFLLKFRVFVFET